MPGTLHSGPVIGVKNITAGVAIDPPCDAINASEDCVVSGQCPNGSYFENVTLTKGWNAFGAKLVVAGFTGTLKAGYI